MHYSVMLAECLDYLAIRPDGIYMDATAGLGGHSAAIGRRLISGYVISTDRDAESLRKARENAADVEDRIRFVQSRFSGLTAALAQAGIGGQSEADLIGDSRVIGVGHEGSGDGGVDPHAALALLEQGQVFVEAVGRST